MPYIEVIPLRKLPLKFLFLDYQITVEEKKNLKIGQLVNIPFRAKNILAVVTKIKTFTTIPKNKIKKINKIINSTPVLNKEQIELFNFLAKYYYVSPALFIKTLVPHPPQKSTKERAVIWPLTKKIDKKISVEKIIKSTVPVLLLYQNFLDRLTAYLSLIKKFKTGQILILIPTKKELTEVLTYLTSVIPKKNIAIITSKLSNSELFNQWQNIAQGKSKIIIGTKITAFAPFKNLKLIVLDNEHNENHQQSEINPRYDISIVAENLSQITKARLIKSSYAPSLEAYFDAKNKKTKIISLKNIKTQTSPIITDLKQEKIGGNYNLLTEKSLSLIKNSFEKNEKILLFINRRGFNTITVCQDCGQTAICPNCKLALNYHQQKNKLICHRCNFEKANWLNCPQCQGIKIKYQGSGTEKLKSEIEKNFSKNQIQIYDSDNIKSLNELKIDKAKIIIGTKFALENLDLSQFHIIISVLTDSLFNQGDYRSTEYTFQLLKSLTLYPETKLVIQTYTPENTSIQNIFQPQIFYQNELAIRKKYNYPPYINIAKLIFQNNNKNILNKEVNEFYYKIKKLPNTYSDLEILNPIVPSPEKIRNNFRQFIIVKYKNETSLANILKLNYNQKILLEKSPNSLTY